MKLPSKETLIDEIRKVIELEGYGISVEVCRAVVRTALEDNIKESDKESYRELFAGDELKKKFREAVEETIKGNLYRNPSIVDELKAPQVRGGVGKKPKSGKKSSKSSGTKKRSPRKSAPRTKKADSGKPKKAQSAYMLWTQTVRKQVTADNPDKKMTELSKIFGEMWKNISDEEREAANELAAKDRERYEKECEEMGVKTAKKKDEGPQKPKKAQSAYMLWTQTVRKQVTADNPEKRVTELAKIFGEMWKKISDEDREEANKLAEKDKERYERECEEFRAKYGEDALPKEKAKRKSTTTTQRRKRPKDDDSFIRDEDATSTSSEYSSSSDSSSSDSDSDSDSSDSDSHSSSSEEEKPKEAVKPSPKSAFKPTPKSALPTKPAAKPSSPVQPAVPEAAKKSASPTKPVGSSPKKAVSPKKVVSPKKAASPKASPKAAPASSPTKAPVEAS